MAILPKDLGLSYEVAMHGMQTAVAYEMNLEGRKSATEPKHLRVGINASMSDHAALVWLLVNKGIITEAEYLEAMRLWANNELALYQERHPRMTFR